MDHPFTVAGLDPMFTMDVESASDYEPYRIPVEPMHYDPLVLLAPVPLVLPEHPMSTVDPVSRSDNDSPDLGQLPERRSARVPVPRKLFNMERKATTRELRAEDSSSGSEDTALPESATGRTRKWRRNLSRTTPSAKPFKSTYMVFGTGGIAVRRMEAVRKARWARTIKSTYVVGMEADRELAYKILGRARVLQGHLPPPYRRFLTVVCTKEEFSTPSDARKAAKMLQDAQANTMLQHDAFYSVLK
ncbi:MAG: hypothetical protein JKY23_04125 [Nitrospinaceae bacterium]|nr:hypothetical protein [Nitrospinaceae bacterium]